MEKRNKILIVSGCLLLLAAGILFGYNQREAALANQKAEQMMSQLTERIEPDREIVDIEKDAEKMSTISLEGDAYMGYLAIPSLQLNMPIMADWSKSNLKVAACRYTGSVDENNLVIMGHNYANGFGALSQLQLGDKIYFHDVNGITIDYKVAAIEVLPSDAIDEMTQSQYALTLFTCTYSGNERVTIRCEVCEE